MIAIVYGTTGELIKLLPLIKSIPEDQQFRINTNQQPEQLQRLMEDTGLPEPHLTLSNGAGGRDLEKMFHIVVWGIVVMFNVLRYYRRIHRSFRANDVKHSFMVHGDTVTTVIGAVMGRFHHKTVVHIEAGMRSHNWRHPFPEELDRVIVSKLARYHFAPGDIPTQNLEKEHAKGTVINTKRNTVLDSLRYAQKAPIRKQADGGFKASKPYYVISIHRNELLSNKSALEQLLQSIQNHAASTKTQAIFLDHPVTKEAIHSLGFDALLEHQNITRLPKLSYYRFIQLVAKSKYVLTDSGGLQEEATFLGIPCMVHRMVTEHQESLNKGVLLTKFKQTNIDKFLADPSKYKIKPEGADIQPTKLTLDTLKEAGYLR